MQAATQARVRELHTFRTSLAVAVAALMVACGARGAGPAWVESEPHESFAFVLELPSWTSVVTWDARGDLLVYPSDPWDDPEPALVRVDGVTGAERWRIPLDALDPSASTSLNCVAGVRHDDCILDDGLVRIDARTGTIVRRYEVDDDDDPDATSLSYPDATLCVVDDHPVVVDTWSGRVDVHHPTSLRLVRTFFVTTEWLETRCERQRFWVWGAGGDDLDRLTLWELTPRRVRDVWQADSPGATAVEARGTTLFVRNADRVGGRVDMTTGRQLMALPDAWGTMLTAGELTETPWTGYWMEMVDLSLTPWGAKDAQWTRALPSDDSMRAVDEVSTGEILLIGASGIQLLHPATGQVERNATLAQSSLDLRDASCLLLFGDAKALLLQCSDAETQRVVRVPLSPHGAR